MTCHSSLCYQHLFRPGCCVACALTLSPSGTLHVQQPRFLAKFLGMLGGSGRMLEDRQTVQGCTASIAMLCVSRHAKRPIGRNRGLALVQSPTQRTASACRADLGQVQVPQSIHAPMCTTTPSSPAKAQKLAAGPWQKLPGPRLHPHTYLLSNARWSHTPPSQLPRVCPMPTAPCAAEAAHGSSSHRLGLRAPHLLPSSLRHPSCPPRLPCGTPPAQRVPPGGHEPPEEARTLGGHQTLS